MVIRVLGIVDSRHHTVSPLGEVGSRIVTMAASSQDIYMECFVV